MAPYYNKPNAEGLYQHFKAVAECSPIPVVLYNVPSRTGVNITAETTLKLARECENIIGIKEASGNLNQVAYIIKDAPETFFVISGDDNLALPIIALGGDGVISVSANAFAADVCEMIHAALDDNMVIARSKYYKLLVATDAIFAEGNPCGVKCALSLKNISTDTVRLPLVKASDNIKNKLQQEIEKYKI
ncbi:MAG: 4-hydroxy-tetrahydrodipicolinate synthase [Rikenellaceae bacterium]